MSLFGFLSEQSRGRKTFIVICQQSSCGTINCGSPKKVAVTLLKHFSSAVLPMLIALT